MIQDIARFEAAIQKFDEANAADPNTEIVAGQTYPKEVIYAHRMSECLSKVAPNASEALLLAVRCQHIRRWEISRKEFSMDVQGYNKWRNTQAFPGFGAGLGINAFLIMMAHGNSQGIGGIEQLWHIG